VTPKALDVYLTRIVDRGLKMSVMIWGAPGIGKSSVVASVARTHGLECTDLRLSQLAPTDLRGLPVPADGVVRWLPPEFLPRAGKGVLFLDELNMAPPTMQGIAQQLILDRRVGSYVVPEGWFIWAAGNRKEDRASTFEMPTPLANRFLHLEVGPDPTAFRDYGLEHGLEPSILSFLAFRPALLHRIDSQRSAWPSPRSWEMASRLHAAGLDVAAAVGDAAAAEFAAFVAVCEKMPKLHDVVTGRGLELPFPEEPSARYATAVGLGITLTSAEEALHAFRWLMAKAAAEWVQLFASYVITRLRQRGELSLLTQLMKDEPRFAEFLREYQALIEL
jgi:hypothetical protein